MRGEVIRERVAAQEAVRLLRAKPRKFGGIVAGLYLGSLVPGIGPAKTSIARAAYLFMRHIDDVLDGDIKDATGNALVPTKVSEFRTSRHPIAVLGSYALSELTRRQQPGDDVASDFQRLINSCVFDHERAKDGRFLSAEELREYYDNTMRATNLMLIGLGSPLRQDGFPDFASSIGAVYSIRDLRTDWPRGIYNVPIEAVEAAFGQDNLQTPTSVELLSSPGIISWRQSTMVQAHEVLSATCKMIADTCPTDPGGRILRMFAGSAARCALSMSE